MHISRHHPTAIIKECQHQPLSVEIERHQFLSPHIHLPSHLTSSIHESHKLAWVLHAHFKGEEA